jgi:hypothetical protein
VETIVEGGYMNKQKEKNINPTCKHCGLLKSTIDATGKSCISEPNPSGIAEDKYYLHDFGELMIHPPELPEEIKREFREKFGYANLVGAERERFEHQENWLSLKYQEWMERGKKEERERIKEKVEKMKTNKYPERYDKFLSTADECSYCGAYRETSHRADCDRIIELNKNAVLDKVLSSL